MLSKTKRLSKNLFKEVILKGRYAHSPLFLLKTISTNQPSQFSVSVPHKIAKNAVTRNKIRRRMYSVINKLYTNIKEGFQVVFIMKNESKESSIENMAKETILILGKLGILK